jgi:SSS family solute:Na+ symporter
VSLHLALLLAYLGLQVGIGLWLGRRVKTASDFFVAGRRLGPGLLFATMIAGNIGAGTTIGAAGEGYRSGIGTWWWVGSAGIGSLVLAFIVGPRLRRVAADLGLRTAGDFLERRYDPSVRTAVTALLWLGTLSILGAQLIAAGKILHVVTGLPPVVGIVLSGAVAVAYFSAGGLMTAVWVNLIQLGFEVAVLCVLVPLSIAQAGGWDALVARTPGGDYWNFWSGWRYLILLGPAFVVSPGLIQKVYGARDDRAVRVGVGLNAGLLLAFGFVPALLGMTARALHPALVDQELALPTLLMSDLSPVVGAMALAVLFTTDVNTADTVLFMLSTSLAQDLYRGYVHPGASDERVLKVARVSAIASGTLGILAAILAASILDALTIFYTLVGVSLLVPIVGGLFVRRAGKVEAFGSMAAGVGATLALHLATGGKGVGVVSPALAGHLAAVVAFALLTSRRPAIPDPERGEPRLARPNRRPRSTV